MNRREFLKSTLIALLPALYPESVKEKELERCIEDTKHMNDKDFYAYVAIQTYLYCHSPRACAVITGICEP